MTDLSKAALNLWCGRKKLKIVYDIEAVNGAFRCVISIDSINHNAVGRGPNKKSASNQAAWTMLGLLTEKQYLTKEDLAHSSFDNLKVREVLFPDGKPVKLDELKLSLNLEACTISNAGTNGSGGSQQQQQQPKPSPSNGNKNQPDWWNNTGMPNNGPKPVASPYERGFQRSPRPGPYPPPIPPPIRIPPGVPPPIPPQYQQPPPVENWYEMDPGPPGPPPPVPIEELPPPPGPFFGPSSGPQDPRDPYNPMYWQGQENYYQQQQDQGWYDDDGNFPYGNQQPASGGGGQPPYRKRKTLDYSKANPSAPSEGSEVVPAAPSIGGFNLDNAKQQLHQFFQIHRIKTDYEYDSQGPPHAKTFTAKLHFTIRQFGREINVTEKGQSKQDASRQCALTILHQLHREGLIEEFKPDAPSKRQLLKMNLIYEITVSPYLKNMMVTTYGVVQSYNQCINPNATAPIYGPGYATFFNPLAQHPANQTALANQQNDLHQPNYLYWCPPLHNFNPWTGTKPDDPIFAGKSMEDINVYLQDSFQSMIKTSRFQQTLATRMQLPIYCIKEQVISLTSDHPVLIIKGSTGCGKTTQVPQFILDTYMKNGNGANCNIVVTQPRRISAISIAERVAFERTETLSAGKSSVGYSVRFDHIYPRPYGSILFCTTGHLLRRIQSGLKGVSHLIIDEVHERDTNTDLLLVIVRDLIKMGLELKVVIMSATIGVQRFQKYFNNCHVLEIDGSLFPVQRYFLEDTIEIIKWRPRQLSYIEDDYDVLAAGTEAPAANEQAAEGQPSFSEDSLMDYDQASKEYSKNTMDLMRRLREGVICFELVVAILEYINQMYITGAVLIFLPGWAAIFELLNFLKAHPTFGDESRFLLLPLHSQLSYKDNHRVFEKVAQRKIILSTNIAETSVTIDDVVFVIDTCLLKRKVYCSRTNVTSYIVDWVSKSNIQQRQGRAGRVRSGYFFALCSRKRFETLEDFKIPEILVTSLVETCLLVKYLGFGNVPEFLNKCLDRPSPRSVQEALHTLRDINAFDEHDQLTPLGTILVKLPIDPRLGRMVMLSLVLGVAGPALTIAAASATMYELFDTSNQLDKVTRMLIKLDEERISDHLIIFKLYHIYEKQLNLHEYRDALNLNAIFQVQNARRQLMETLVHVGMPVEAFDTKLTYTAFELDIVLGTMVAAFYPNVCLHKESRRILTNEEKIGLVHKTSVLNAYIAEQRYLKSTSLKSPLFVYTEKSANRALITSKHMSMVSFMQLLLFGVRKYEFPPNLPGQTAATDTIVLDGWLEVKIDPQVFDCVWLMKTELENILTRVCFHPPTLSSLSHIENQILDTARNMCSMDNVSVQIRVNNAKPPLLNNV